jgi:hypothetical protein
VAAQQRAICATCGHTQDWHDRDAVRTRMRGDPAIDRPCYREVGGAACRCGGFRDSGESAVADGTAARQAPAVGRRLIQNAVLTLLLVVMGLALLYAYRSQTPSIPQVSVTEAIADINAGNVKTVTITANKATLELRSGSVPRKQTTVAVPDQLLTKAIIDYNAGNPSKQVELRYLEESQSLSVVGSIVLSLLPVLLIGGFFYYMMRLAQRR